MSDIKIELRTRRKQKAEFWSIRYDTTNGQILSIEPGQTNAAGYLVVTYPRVQDLLAGKANQNDYKIGFNENLGVIDLIDIKRPSSFKKKQIWKGWLSTSEYYGDPLSDLRVILFNDTGQIRVETTRLWSTQLKEKISHESLSDSLPMFITDEEDPHQLFGNVNINLNDIIERGYWESRLWAFMDHNLVTKILFQGQRVRINMPPVGDDLFFTRASKYTQYTGVSDEQTVISHVGPGKHVSIFLKEGKVWAQSHYEQGSPIDQLVGNVSIAVLNADDPEYFVNWTTLPALMLRQTQPFELLPEWPYPAAPHVLYKANNIDIGVVH